MNGGVQNMRVGRAAHIGLLVASAFALAVLLSASVAPPSVPGPSAPLAVTLDPAKSTVHWTLSATGHTVHGTFHLAHGKLQLDPTSGRASGEIVALATSGESGSSGRDQKMHKDVLESGKFADITFKPDRFEGPLNREGKSSVKLHGTMTLHGADHELLVPVEALIEQGHWTATAKFTVPYVEWGLKNPSNFLLRVAKSVDLELELSGSAENAPAS